MIFPAFLLPLSFHLIYPYLFQSVLHHSTIYNHITLPLSVCLSVDLREDGADPAFPDWRGNHNYSFSIIDHVFLHHADLHSSPSQPNLPSVSPHPHLLHPKWGWPQRSDSFWSSPWHPLASPGPKLCHCFPGHPLRRATSRKAAFSSCWAKTSMDRGIRGQFLPQCLLPVCWHIIPWLPGQWDVESQHGDEWGLSVSQCLGALLT